jgi:hypothetical protein
MDTNMKTAIWRQFGASIDMLENAIKACPEDVWVGKRGAFSDFWYLASHTLFWLDFYLSDSVDGFVPPPPFGLEELDPAGALPPRVYSKDELLAYLEHGRKKCRMSIIALTSDSVHRDCGSKRPGLTNLEILLYNMRHVQHHAAQLNLILRQTIDSAPNWVSKAKLELGGQ